MSDTKYIVKFKSGNMVAYDNPIEYFAFSDGTPSFLSIMVCCLIVCVLFVIGYFALYLLGRLLV